MPFYSDRKRVRGFHYRGVAVEIHRRLKGARHCNLDHFTDQRKCHTCGADIEPTEVFVIVIAGSEIVGLDLPSEDKAIEISQKFVDHLLKQMGNRRDEDGPPEDEGDEEDLIDEDPTNEDNPPEIPPDAADDGDDSPPSDDSPKNRGIKDMNGIVRQMDKLKWLDRAAAIVRGRANKTPDKPK